MKSKQTTKKPAKKQAPRRPAGKIETLEKALGVTRGRIHQLLRDGMPDDIPGAMAWRAQRQGFELKEARLGVLREQERKLELENRVRVGELIEVNSVFQTSLHIHRQLRMRLTEGVKNSLPPQLEGLPAAKISTVLRQFVDDLLETLAEDCKSSRLVPDETEISKL